MFEGVKKQEIRDSARFALQSAAAAAVTFLAMETAGLPEKFVAIISAVLVVQPSVGGTAGKAFDRLIATAFGSAVGILCLAVLPKGFGTAAALAVAMLVMNAVAAFRPDWRYGVVAAVALALGTTEGTTETAIDRGIAIGLGVFIGMLSSFVIWPDSAGSRARRHVRSALIDICNRLSATVEQAFGDDNDDDENKSANARKSFHRHLEDARSAMRSMTGAEKKTIADYIDGVEKLYNSVLLIDRATSDEDDAISVKDDLCEELDDVRELAITIIKGLAGEDVDLKPAMKRLKKRVESIYDDGRVDGDVTEFRLAESVLVFGLGEIYRNLESLIDVSERVYNGDGSAKKLAYMAREAIPVA